MSDLRFSVVIPTRERHETLQYTLKSCLDQDFDNYEIIVSDNCSSPETQRVVDELNSSKIRYVRSEVPLAMTHNFELGVSQARGEYVMVIGDDDALLSYSLRELDKILTQTGVKAIRWDLIFYNWPNMINAEVRNRVVIPVGFDSKRINGEEMMMRVANYECNYAYLPMIYHSAVHRDLIAEHKARTGRIFNGRSPDLYGGFAMAYLAKEYLYIGLPMSISALSGKSTGFAHIHNNVQVVQDYEILNASQHLACHPKVPNVNCVVAAVADAFSVAKDTLFPERSDLDLDWKCLVVNCVVRSIEHQPSDRELNIQAIREALAHQPELLDWFNTHIVGQYAAIRQELSGPDLPPMMAEKASCQDAAEGFGVENVYQMSQVISRLANLPTRLGQSPTEVRSGV